MTASISMNVHQLAARPAAVLAEGGTRPFAVLEVSEHPAQVNLFLRTRAECDALIESARAARDLLPEDAPGGGS